MSRQEAAGLVIALAIIAAVLIMVLLGPRPDEASPYHPDPAPTMFAPVGDY